MLIHNGPVRSSYQGQWQGRHRPRPAILLICSAIACTLMSTAHAAPVLSTSSSSSSASWSLSSSSSSSSSWTRQPELKGRFLQMTDMHPDEHYLDGAAVSASCHTILDPDGGSGSDARGYSGRLHNARLTDRTLSILRPDLFSDNPPATTPGANATAVAGWYGAPTSICDSPLTLVDATFDWIDKNLVDTIDFVVWTGDNARHDSDNTHPRTQEQINAMNKIVADKVLDTFPPVGPDGRRIPIIPSIGNNDIYPHNILQPGPNPILQYFATIWSEFIPESMAKTFARGGYFAVEAVPQKITVFSLNTIYFYVHNTAVDGCKNEDEPGTEQMEWLVNELEKVRKQKMVAYLTGHVPPEKKSYSPTCYSRYTKIALAYQDVIVGHLYGHANIDHFFLLSHHDKGGKGLMDDNEVDEEEREEREEEVVEYSEQDDGYDPFHALGLGSYLEDLWKQYDNVPQEAQLKDYSIVLVSPSVIPTYNPTLRVFSYQLNDTNTSNQRTIDGGVAAAVTAAAEDNDIGMEEQQQQELEEYFSEYLNSGRSANEWTDFSKSHHRHRKPRHQRPDPVPVGTFGFPQGFTQYWCNLTQANSDAPTTFPTYEVEYRTKEDYGLENLGVSEWLALARRIARDEDLKKVYLERMVVQSDADTTADD